MKRIIVIFFIAFASCNTVAKQQRKAESFYNANPEQLAKQCAEKYPPDTLYKQGEVIVKSDTVTIKGDSVDCPPVVDQQGETVYVKAKCPDSKIIHDSITRVDTFINNHPPIVDYLSLQSERLGKELLKTQADRDDEKHASGNKTWWIIGLTVLLGISIFINIQNYNHGRTSKHNTA